MAVAQKFSDPQMPFHREVHNGCAIGTSIIVKAKAYQDTNKTFVLQLNSKTDIALNLSVPINKSGNMTANSRINDQYTSEVQKPVKIPLNTLFVLHIRIDTYVSEVYLNDTHLLDFVHRVNPLEIKEVNLEGPLIVSEVLFSPPQGASLNALPTYDEASKIPPPVPEFANLSIGGGNDLPPPPPGVLNAPQPPRSVAPPPAGTVVPVGAASQMNRPPYPEKNCPSGPPLPKKEEGRGPSGYPPPPSQPMIPQPIPQQIAQVAPQPNAPMVSNMPTQNRPPAAYPPPVSAPGGYVPPTSSYPTAPPGAYPPPTASYPSAPPAQAPNVYPGPNQPPQHYNPYQQQGPSTNYIPQPVVYPQQQQSVYPVYQQSYPTYVAPTYPMYSYPTVYYDDCHHHHHHC